MRLAGTSADLKLSFYQGSSSTVFFVLLFVLLCLFSCAALPKRDTKRSPKSYKRDQTKHKTEPEPEQNSV